jgi:hypothetical protein
MEFTIDDIRAVTAGVGLAGPILSLERIKIGHINDTYRVAVQDGAGVEHRLVCQHLNQYVFPEPVRLM